MTGPDAFQGIVFGNPKKEESKEEDLHCKELGIVRSIKPLDFVCPQLGKTGIGA